MMQAIVPEYPPTAGSAAAPNSPQHRFYRRVLRALNAAGIEFVVGGGYALEVHLGIGRPTKDLDLFLRPSDVPSALDHFRSLGFGAELTFPHWLAKITRRDDQVDLIFNAGNGICPVDDDWFRHAVPSRVLGVPVKLSPVEEMIWSKAFVMERERFDGADVLHLLHACAETLDWSRLTRRFGRHWRVLFAHLTLFGFVYPSERRRIPEAVMRQCVRLLDLEMRSAPARRICWGTLTSRAQYLVDIERWGYEDARLAPHGSMTDDEASIWTAAIDTEVSRPLGTRPADAADDDSPKGGNHNASL
jgi:predicted nucleotidyltransferase